MKTKINSYHRYKKINSVKNEVNYKTYESQLQKLLDTAEKQYHHELLTRYKNSMKKSWGIIKNIIHKNKFIKLSLNQGKKLLLQTTQLYRNILMSFS